MPTGRQENDITSARADVLGRKTMLFAPIDGLAYICPLARIADYMRELGHRTVFMFLKPIKTNLRESGHEVYAASIEGLEDQTVQLEYCKESLLSIFEMMNKTADENCKSGFSGIVDDIKSTHENLLKKLDLIKPDLVIVSHMFGIPALSKDRKIPWVRIHVPNPLQLYENIYEFYSDESLASFSIEQEKRARQIREIKHALWAEFNEWWKSIIGQDLPSKPLSYMPISPHLNIYIFPEELDYAPLDNWHRCDSMIRDMGHVKKFEVPEKLRNKPGKLIFLSLGSLACADIELMKRLVSMLSDSPHRFIVNKGPRGDAYELADNMWGANLLPQLEILQSIDLIITQGGNSTVHESFYYGVPGFIVCPILGDHPDNAQRLLDKDFGLRLDPYKCTKEQLHEAIETMLNRTDIRDRMKAISERMRKPEVRDKPFNLITDLLVRSQSIV